MDNIDEMKIRLYELFFNWNNEKVSENHHHKAFTTKSKSFKIGS